MTELDHKLAPTGSQHRGPLAAFSKAFEDAWRAPTAERLTALLHADVVLYQSGAAAIHGKDAAHREFSRLLRWLPALRGEVDQSFSNEHQVCIQWRLILPFGPRGIALRIVDVFIVEDGRARSRHAYFDQTPFILAVLSRPWRIGGFLRYRFGRT